MYDHTFLNVFFAEKVSLWLDKDIMYKEIHQADIPTQSNYQKLTLSHASSLNLLFYHTSCSSLDHVDIPLPK